MNRYLFLIIILIFLILPFNLRAASAIFTDSLVKGSLSTIYYYASDGYRYVFPNNKTYESWFNDYSQVQTVADGDLSQIPLGGNVTYRPGIKMIKITTNPKVYAVAKGGVLRWVKTEETARELYGENWSKKIDDVPDSFFVNYEEGEPIESASDYDSEIVSAAVMTINSDKGIIESGSTVQADTEVGSISSEEPLSDDSADNEILFPEPESPVISNVRVSSIGEDTVTIEWRTDVTADSKVSYATSSPVSSADAITNLIDMNYTTNHSVSPYSLTADAVYYYTVVSTDENGKTSTSSEQSFTTVTSFIKTSEWKSTKLAENTEGHVFVWNNSGCSVVYKKGKDLFFLKIDSNGNTKRDPVSLLGGGDFDIIFSPELVFNGEGYGLSWVGNKKGVQNLYFATLDVNGNKLTEISVTDFNDIALKGEKPVLIWTGNNYALSWVRSNSVYFAKVASNGENFIVKNKNILTTAKSQENNGAAVSLAWNGINFGISWVDIRNAEKPAIYYNILNSKGESLLADTKISGTGMTAGEPHIFSDREYFDIFWRESTAHDVNDNSVYFTKMDSSGMKITCNINLNTKGDNETNVAVTNGDNGYGVVWTSDKEDNVYFKGVNKEGVITSTNSSISGINGSNDRGKVLWSGFEYAVIWQNIQDNISSLYFADESQANVLGVKIKNNSLSMKPTWLVKDKQSAKVYYVNKDLCLRWIVNEKSALKHFGTNWNKMIKEFGNIQGYKFCENLE